MYVTMKTHVMLAGKMVFLNFVFVDEHFRQPLASDNSCVTVIIVMLLGIILFLIFFILMTSLVGFSCGLSFLNDNASRKSEKLDKSLPFKSFVHE